MVYNCTWTTYLLCLLKSSCTWWHTCFYLRYNHIIVSSAAEERSHPRLACHVSGDCRYIKQQRLAAKTIQLKLHECVTNISAATKMKLFVILVVLGLLASSAQAIEIDVEGCISCILSDCLQCKSDCLPSPLHLKCAACVVSKCFTCVGKCTKVCFAIICSSIT